MIYRVEISKSASKQLKNLPVHIQERLESKIQQLGLARFKVVWVI